MPKVIVTAADGMTSEIEGAVGISMMLALRDGGRDKGINEQFGLCGGCCTCYTCHVWIDEAFLARLSPPSPQECDLLDLADHRRSNSRLACQIPLTESLDGIRVALPHAD